MKGPEHVRSKPMLRKGLIAGGGAVLAGRVFLVEPKTLPPERKEKLGDSRVDFRIR